MKSNKMFLIVVVVVAIATFAGFMLWSKKSDEAATPARPKADASLLTKPHSPVKGAADAKVTIVEFLDPECEACRAMHPIVKRLLAEYEGKVKLVIRYLPLHGNSKYAAAVLEEAREQGKYDQALDVLFERQPEWADHAQPKPELIPVLLEPIGLDKKALESSVVVAKHGSKIDIDHSDAMKLGARYTPTFFVDGEMLYDIGYEPLKAAIEKSLAGQ